MGTYVIIHGSVRVGAGNGPEAFKRVGEEVQLDDDFVKSIDPKGESFVSTDTWLKLEQIKELQKEIEELSDDEKAEALASVVEKKKTKKEVAS